MMSAFQNGHSLASTAVLKLVQQYDKNVTSVADLKNGTTLLNLFLELNASPYKTYQCGRNPFQYMKKCIKKSAEKDFLHHVNLDQCEKGNDAELLSLTSSLLCALHSQQKENVISPSDVLSNQEANVLWSVWMEHGLSSFSSNSNSRPSRTDPLKECNFLPKLGSPHKNRSNETPSALKKEIRKKEMCIANLRTLLDEEQERISELLHTKKSQDEQISKLEKVTKDQQQKLASLSETTKLSYDIQDFQEHIKTLTREKEKLELKVKELKCSKKELDFVEAENVDLRNTKDGLDIKVTSLQDFNKRLSIQVMDLEKKHCESALLQQRLDILNEELRVKEETILELNNMIAVYQDKLDVQRTENSVVNLDMSDDGEIVGEVCSPFRDSGNELTALQNEVNGLQYENDKLESNLKETTSSLQKSNEGNKKLEREVDTLQKLVDHLNWQVQDNQSTILNLEAQIDNKDRSVADMTIERDRLLDQVRHLAAEIKETKQQLMNLQHEQEESLRSLRERDEEIRMYKDDIKNFQNDLKVLGLEKGELLGQVKNLEEFGRSLKSEIATGNWKIQALFSQLQELEERITCLKFVNNEQAESLKSLKDEKSNIENALAALKEDHTMLVNSYEKSSFEKEKITLEFDSLQKEYLVIKTKEASLQTQIDTFQEDSNCLKKEMILLVAEKQQLLKTIEEVKSSNVSLSKDLKDMETQVTLAQNSNFELQAEKAQILALHDKLQKSVVDLETQLKEVSEKYEYALKSIESLSSDLSSAKIEISDLKELHSDVKSDLFYLKEEHGKLQEKYEESLSLNQTYSTDIETIQQQFYSANNKIMELADSLKVAKEECDTLYIQNNSLVKQKFEAMEKSAHFEQETRSLHEMKSILSTQIEELLSEKLMLQAKLRGSCNKVDANTSACNLSFIEDTIECESIINISNYTVDKSFEDVQEIQNTECEELLKKVESLLLDLKSKEKYIEFLELEKQQAVEKLNALAAEFQKHKSEKEIELNTLNNKCNLLDAEIQAATSQKNNSDCELVECRMKVDSLKDELDVVLNEKAEVISALCEKEESLKLLEDALNQARVLNSEQSSLMDEKNVIISNAQEELSVIRTETEHLLSELEKKEKDLEKNSFLSSELDDTRNKLNECEYQYSVKLSELQNKLEHHINENKALSENLNCQNSHIDGLTTKLLIAYQTNDMLVAETVREAREIICLKEIIKQSAKDIEHYKCTVDSCEKLIGTLQNTIHELNGQLSTLLTNEHDQKDKITLLEIQLTNSNQELEKLRASLKEKSKMFDCVVCQNEKLVDKNESLVLQTVNDANEIQNLNAKLLSFLQKDTVSCDKDTNNVKIMNLFKNPALKEWLDQFDSLSNKIQDMKSKAIDEKDEKDACSLENNTLSMIRDHIHHWLKNSEFLFQDSNNEVSQLFKHSLQASSVGEHSVNNVEKRFRENGSSEPVVSVPCKSVCLREKTETNNTETTERLQMESEMRKIYEEERQQRFSDQKEFQEKVLTLKRKFEQKEKEAALYKEALAMYKQKVEDVKKLQHDDKVKNGDNLARINEQNNLLQQKLATAQAKSSEMEKKYLDEMKVVHKKYQEKINLLNSTSKDLSQAKMQLVNFGKQYSDLSEKYTLTDSKLKSANASLKKQRLENESLKTELQNIRRSKEQMKKEDYYARRMTMLPSTSFMQQSFSSSVDMSLDSSIFAKPMVPASRFTCDEEEGQFLDQSRNVSDLQEGRVRLPEDNSNKTRLQELKRRNTLCKPHLRSYYPIETQNMADESIEGMIRTPLNAKKNPHASSSATSTTASVEKKVEGQRKRKEFWQIPVDMSTPAKKTNKVSDSTANPIKGQNRKPPFFKVFSPFRKEKPKNPVL